MSTPIKLLINRTTNLAAAFKAIPGGEYQLCIWGTYDGATVKLRMSPDGTNELPVATALTFSAATAASTFTVGEGCHVGPSVESAGASTDISMTLLPVPRR